MNFGFIDYKKYSEKDEKTSEKSEDEKSENTNDIKRRKVIKKVHPILKPIADKFGICSNIFEKDENKEYYNDTYKGIKKKTTKERYEFRKSLAKRTTCFKQCAKLKGATKTQLKDEVERFIENEKNNLKMILAKYELMALKEINQQSKK